MKLADRSETVPFFLDQAAIALMQLSINHLQLLETMAEELQALTTASMRGPIAKDVSLMQQGVAEVPAVQDEQGKTESTWER
jgi:hypothetical protein